MGAEPDTRVVLDVSGRCVETAAKHEHRRLVDALVAGTAGERDADRVSLLKEFLERGDFRALRSEHPELAGGAAGRVALCRLPGGGSGWRIIDGDGDDGERSG